MYFFIFFFLFKKHINSDVIITYMYQKRTVMNYMIYATFSLLYVSFPLYSMNKTSSLDKHNPGASQESTIDRANQQGRPTVIMQDGRGWIESATRYAWQWGEEGQRAIIGIDAKSEEQKISFAIYQAYKTEIEAGRIDAALQKKLSKRRNLTIDFVEHLIISLRQNKYTPQDIQDGSLLLTFPDIDCILPRFLHEQLIQTIANVATNEEYKYAQIRKTVAPKQEGSE
jgi:hypothetical protein